jgi:sigma-B regulation protein RsbU (phosphoserine phosphatase)
MAETAGRLEPKLLYRRLDSLLGALDPSRPQRPLLESFLDDAFRSLKDDLRLRAALLYGERRDGFELLKAAGEALTPLPELLEPTLPALGAIFRHRVYIFPNAADEAAPERFGVLPPGPAAGLVVGRRPRRYLLLFAMRPGWHHDELDFALNTLRAALGARLADERVRGSFREAAEIQQSLLLDEPPSLAGYEIACRSLPTEEVSGDFYDFYSFDEEMLGLAVGDASGHGLPAALLVRDVVTGLRMGIEKDLRVEYVFAKLNRVIHRSNLSSRFVSVFYGELETNGNLVFVNAGHQPPLLLAGGRATELADGGTVIGPLPEARFRRGFAHVPAGGVLVLGTDGIHERRDRAGRFFGREGLEAAASKHRKASAEQLLERIFAAAFDHGDGRPWEDDATLVVVRRLPE